MKTKIIYLIIILVVLAIVVVMIASSNKNKEVNESLSSMGQLESSMGNNPAPIAPEVIATPPTSETKVTPASIVKTSAGDEFGINLDSVVNFFNGNVVLRKIMSDFNRVNLVFEDKANNRNLELKAEISDGKITSLADGSYGNSDVTIYMPLADALNIFSNASNLTAAKVISLAVNLRTDPSNIKNDIIGKFLRGEYK